MKTYSEQNLVTFTSPEAPCFADLLPGEMELIRGSKTQVMFHKGESLVKQGAFGSGILFIISGLARQYVEEGSQRNFNLRLVGPGEFTGLSAVFHRNVYDYSVVALKDTLVCLIEKEAITELVRQNGQFAFGLIRRYSEQNSLLYDSIRRIVYKQMNGRLAETLLYLGTETYQHESVFTLLSRKDIADFAGLSTESTVKLLKSFEKDGIIRLEEKDILILDRDALLNLSKRG
jgi:CRP/FNR family transcriptional regulator